jgi:hypothetical protein
LILVFQIRGASLPEQNPETPPSDIPNRPDEGMSDAQVKLRMELYVKEQIRTNKGSSTNREAELRIAK